MVQSHHQWAFEPAGYTTDLAAVALEAGRDQPVLQLVARASDALDEQELERRRDRAGDDVSPQACGIPRLTAESEPFPALRDRVPSS
jgi:hypothetical protein